MCGLENKEAARRLGISEQAVKDHVSTLLQKFGVANRAALVALVSRLEFTGSLEIEHTWPRQFFREAAVQICVLRGPDLRYATVNDSFRRAVGERELIGRTMREAFPELDGQGVYERVENVYATGIPLIESEVVRRWDTGSGIQSRRVTLVLQPLRDGNGSVNGVISFAIDVTAEATPESALAS